TGRRPFLTSAAWNFAPVGLAIVPFGETVVKQMLFSMIREGYIARKSREMTHSYRPGCRLWTYPPSICSTRPPRIFILATATCARSAARIRIESIRFEEIGRAHV